MRLFGAVLGGQVLVLSTVVTLVGCGGSTDLQPPRTLVLASRLWSQPNERDYVDREILRAFEESHEVEVVLQQLDDEALFQRARLQQEAGMTLGDVVIVYGSRMKDWQDGKYVLELEPEAARWADRHFWKTFVDRVTLDGKQAFLPIGADVYLLCANRKALRHLPRGFDVQHITWEQVVVWARDMAAAEGGGKFAFTAGEQAMLVYEIGCAVLAYGGGFPDVGSPEALAAWQQLVRFHGVLTPRLHEYASVVPAMKSEEAWLTVTQSARVGEICASNPSQFVVAPPPRGPAGIGSVAGLSGIGVVRGTPNAELAFELLDHLTSPQVQHKLSQGTGGFLPTVQEAVNLRRTSAADEVVHQSMIVLREGRLAYVPRTDNWGAIKLVVEDAFHRLVVQAGAVDVAYLRGAQGEIEALLTDARKGLMP